MAANKKEKHKCPAIGPEWSAKGHGLTGPAYRPGMTNAEAKTAWLTWVRILNSGVVRPMPRRTY